MKNNSQSLAHCTDAQLLIDVKLLAASEREATVRLIMSLAELDARRLYLGEGFPSLFAYCVQCLHLSEHAAYNRIEAARAVRQWPEIYDRLAEGALTLTSVRLLAPHLTIENRGRVLDAARHKSRREVERLVAALHPQPDVPATIRKLPTPKAPEDPGPAEDVSTVDSPPPAAETPLASAVATPADPERAPVGSMAMARRPVVALIASPTSRPAVVVPLAPERYKVQFTVSVETHDKLRRAQDLLRHAIPNGDPAEIFDRALTLLVAHLEKTRQAATTRPRPPREAATDSRHIPAAVKRTVWERDDGQCAFVGTGGRCAERGFLECHHVVPFAEGGAATEGNIQLRCRAHNQHEAIEWFGSVLAGPP